ncbi:cytotoxic and regulatory T-cell molecule isoform X2 [Danio aesculapii]|uniref:cytotoxic and regulatory T-cell molecule isoform X2 n=1 Tax=Danio aesculapii TaxID=1142201 RepID=UPI0024C0C547|nr:cytotoxic and regulatory T-cell molecule isoform X2 [Danio aesculapii]
MKLLFFLWILPVTSADNRVTCVFSEACMLPCKSNYHSIIHWYNDKAPVHSFYRNEDQLAHQSEEYKGRTSLPSESEINTGNVSLMLTNIKIQDEGRYKCYTANDKSNNEQFVSVSVEAPVRSLNITLVHETVTCTTSGVYPEPDVRWSSSNPLAKDPLNKFSKTEENLLTVTSILKVHAINETYKYNCSIINKDTGTILYTAILEQQELPVTEFTYKCPVTKGLDYTLIVSFSTTVFKYDSKASINETSDQWKPKITFHPENGTIKLSQLNEEQSGKYTLDCTTGQYRHIVKATILQGGMKIAHVIIGVITSCIVIAGIVLVVIYKNKLKTIFSKKQNTSDHSSEEMKLQGETNGTSKLETSPE